MIASTSHCFDHRSYACCYDVVDGGPGLRSDHDDDDDDEADGDDHDHDVHDCDEYHDSFDPDSLCPRDGYNQTDDFSANPHLAVDEGMWKFFELSMGSHDHLLGEVVLVPGSNEVEIADADADAAAGAGEEDEGSDIQKEVCIDLQL